MDTFINELVRRINKIEYAVARAEIREIPGWEIHSLIAAPVASLTVTLPQYGRHLQIRGVMRSAIAADSDSLYIRVNADATNQYSGVGLTLAEYLAAAQWTIGTIPAATATAKYYGFFDMTLYRYWSENADISKVGFTCTHYSPWSVGAGDRSLDVTGGEYAGAAPITSITFWAAGGNLAANSMITLYATN